MAEKTPAADSNPKDTEENEEPQKAQGFPTQTCFTILASCFFILFILIITTVAVQTWAYVTFPEQDDMNFGLFKCTDCPDEVQDKNWACLRVERCGQYGWDDGLCEMFVAMDRASIVVIVCEISILVMIIMVLERLAFHMGKIYYGEKNVLHLLAVLMMGAQATALGYWVEASHVTYDDVCRVMDVSKKPMMCGDTGSELLIVIFLLTEILCLALIFSVYKTKETISQKRQYYHIGSISQQGCMCTLFFYLITVVFIMVLDMSLHDWVQREDNFAFNGSLFSRREEDGSTTPYNCLATTCDFERNPGLCKMWDHLELASIDYVYIEAVSWIFIVLWAQGIIGAAVRLPYGNPMATLGYGGIAFLMHFIAIVVWFGRAHARFEDCTEFNEDPTTVPDACGTQGPRLSIALIFMLLVAVAWYAVGVLGAKAEHASPSSEQAIEMKKQYKHVEDEESDIN